MTPKKYYQIIVGIMIGLAVVGAGGYWYALNALNDASADLATQKSLSDSADTRVANLKNTQNRYQKLVEPLLPQINEALPNTSNQTEILSQLQTAAKTSSVSLSSVTFQGSAGKPVAGVIPLSMSFQVTGNFTHVQAFLADVENLSRITTVDSLTATASGKTITYAINLTAYSKP